MNNLITNRFWIIIILVLIIPILLILFGSIALFGDLTEFKHTILENRNNLTFGSEAYPTLSDVLYYIITIYSIFITAIFSYVIWKASMRSNEVAEAIKSLEETRDSEIVRQSALIVYYELLTGFYSLRDLYISLVVEKTSPNPKKLFFSDDWVKNISLLKNDLNLKEINEVHKLYNKFLTLKSLLDSENENEKSIEYVIDMIDSSFASFLPKELIANDYGNISKYLNRNFSILLSKIRVSTYSNKYIIEKIDKNEVLVSINDLTVYEGAMLENLYDGKGILYNEEGLPKYEGVFSKGRFISGKLLEYFDSGKILYEIHYENEQVISGYLVNCYQAEEVINYYLSGQFLNNEINNGTTIKFDNNHQLLYEGEVENGMYSGNGILYYKGKIKFRGKFERGKETEGELFGENGLYFKGEFKRNNPWTGIVRNYNYNNVMEFSGTIESRKPVNGSGLVFHRDSMGNRYDEIPDSEDCSIEEQTEDFKELQHESWNNDIRENYYEWYEYIKAKWSDGNYIKEADKESNIRMTYRIDSKIK